MRDMIQSYQQASEAMIKAHDRVDELQAISKANPHDEVARLASVVAIRECLALTALVGDTDRIARIATNALATKGENWEALRHSARRLDQAQTPPQDGDGVWRPEFA